MMPCARLTDMHVCPMVTPGVPPVPHVGGPVLPPCVPTVLVMGLPAAPLGNTALCVGPPDALVKGSATVMVMNRPVVRIAIDTTAHGGIVAGPGAPTVLVGG
ncbi:MAG: PAAR domain-containing protein [Rhodosalinus sp.]|uniref:PAAR domain-containing protein n=1 Tax=Rhodosalinus sp. TaxID=2047741 RepID=UPI00397CC45B